MTPTFLRPDPQAVRRLWAADRALQERLATLWQQAAAVAPDAIGCGAGCRDCCGLLFDITLLDGWRLSRAMQKLPTATRERLAALAQPQWLALCAATGHDPRDGLFGPDCPPDDWPELACPCALLDVSGRCLFYAARPIVCRRHGLPLCDGAGALDPAALCEHHRLTPEQALAVARRWPEEELYRQEGALERQALLLLRGSDDEVVTCVPAVLAGALSFPEVG